MTHWTQSYFGEIYGEIYRQFLMPAKRAKQEAAFAARTLGLRGHRVLDLASGYGRHARILAHRNQVVALDRNINYLQQARQSPGINSQRNLFPVCGDMRILPFGESSFDAVLLLFNSFGYFTEGDPSGNDNSLSPVQRQVWKLPQVYYERQLVSADFGTRRLSKPQIPVTPTNASTDQDTPGFPVQSVDQNFQVLQEAHRVLRPKGGFLLEAANPAPLLASVLKHPRRHVIASRYEIEEEYTWDAATRTLRNRTRFRLGRKEEDGEYTIRLYDPVELRNMLRAAGFRKLKAYGSYEGTPFRKTSSDILLYQAER